MVFIKGKTVKQYHRDNYEKNKEKIKKARRERYQAQKRNTPKTIVIEGDGTLIIKVKNIVICEHKSPCCNCY